MLDGFGVYFWQHPRIVSHIIQLFEIWRTWWSLVVSSETRTFLNLITCSLWKNAHLTSTSYNFWVQRNIAMKYAGYVARILLCKYCEYDKSYNKSRDIKFFLGDYYFMARPVVCEDIRAMPIFVGVRWLSLCLKNFPVIFTQKSEHCPFYGWLCNNNNNRNNNLNQSKFICRNNNHVYKQQ